MKRRTKVMRAIRRRHRHGLDDRHRDGHVVRANDVKRKAIIIALSIGAVVVLAVGIASHFVQFNAYLWGHDFAASSLSFACWEPGRLRIEIMANESRR